jgi:hypothetical protein
MWQESARATRCVLTQYALGGVGIVGRNIGWLRSVTCSNGVLCRAARLVAGVWYVKCSLTIGSHWLIDN